MADVNNQSNISNEKRPSVAVGAYIVNKEGKIFFVRGPHFSNKLIVPGGHIEHGEKAEDAVRREIMEETGLTIKSIQFLTAIEFIFDPCYKNGDKHLICLDYKAELEGEPQPKLESKEASEYFWLNPKDALERDDLEEQTRHVVEEYFLKEKKGLFHRDYKHCDKHKKEAEEYKTGWQRAVADYRNLQKEIENRKSEWFSMSEQQILEEFIPVYDNFKKSMFHAPNGESPATPAPLLGQEGKIGERWENWRQGIEYIMKQFGDILRAHGVEEIKTVGEKFDPKFHEAVGEEESKGGEPHIILREVDGGYAVKDRAIKVARVIVSK